jgi:tetratricopeptide (TPR) repeat protein
MADFDELLATANDLLDESETDKAGPALDAALAAARTPGEQALALNGIAFLHRLHKETDKRSEVLDRSIGLAEAHLQTDPQDSRARLALADAVLEQSKFKFRPDDFENERLLLDKSLERFLEATSQPPRDRYDRQLQRIIARTLWRKGLAWGHEVPRKAVDCLNDVLRRFQDSDDLTLQHICAYASVARGVNLAVLGRSDEQIAVYDDVIARYGGSKERDMREVVLRALEEKLLAYREQEDFEATLEVCDDLLDRYGTDSDYYATDATARTLIRKGDVLNKLGKMGPELACYDQVINTWASDESWIMRKHAAEALLAKAVALNEADQAGAEMECYDELVRRYAEDDDDSVRAVAADALVHKGLSFRALSEDAAEDTGMLQIDDEIACYDRVIARYGDETSHEMRRALSAAYFHKGESLLETGRRAEAADCFDEVIAHPSRAYDPYLEELVDEAARLRREC